MLKGAGRVLAKPEQVRAWRLLLGASRRLRPLLDRLGLDRSALDEMSATLDTLSAIRDSFNDL